MFLTYLDDAGSAKNPDEEYLVLGGVCISEHQVNDLTHALETLASKYDPTAPDAVEFHASAIYTGKVKPWNGLRQQLQRREVLKEVLGIVRVAQLPACALACAVHKKSIPNRDPMEMAFEELCRWFDGFLKARHAQTTVDEKGMIFIDESTYETTVRQIARNFRRLELTTNDGRYIVDGPHLVKSHNTRCVQFADHIAYAVFRYFHAQARSIWILPIRCSFPHGNTLVSPCCGCPPRQLMRTYFPPARRLSMVWPWVILRENCGSFNAVASGNISRTVRRRVSNYGQTSLEILA